MFCNIVEITELYYFYVIVSINDSVSIVTSLERYTVLFSICTVDDSYKH